MEQLIAGGAIAGLVIVLSYSLWKRSQRASAAGRIGYPAHRPPQTLGIYPGNPAYEAAVRLEQSIPADYELRVKERLQQRQPELSDTEWQWRWHEQKRFLLMAALLRRVEMYSAQVDEVWHEMLMFTMEYQKMCERFCGRMIHHAPHSGTPLVAGAAQQLVPSAERAWFDWVYGELFGPENPGARLWGGMYRTPMSPGLLELLGLPDEDKVRRELFHAELDDSIPELIQARENLLTQARAQMAAAHEQAARGERHLDRAASDTASWSLLGGTLMLASLTAPDDLAATMDEVLGHQQRQPGSTSSCGGAAGGGTERDNDGSDESSGDGGGGDTSCSSCSGGCGSS
ncbi:hypothetical protein [Paenibacillus sp. 1P07SE]|uniref:hypothetical protein n=1 Tax=Paenibacillus sp. 1P07SE TaxID=3132209 RepID=UPI0039A692E8